MCPENAQEGQGAARNDEPLARDSLSEGTRWQTRGRSSFLGRCQEATNYENYETPDGRYPICQITTHRETWGGGLARGDAEYHRRPDIPTATSRQTRRFIADISTVLRSKSLTILTNTMAIVRLT